jgi:tight adherence protein B
MTALAAALGALALFSLILGVLNALGAARAAGRAQVGRRLEALRGPGAGDGSGMGGVDIERRRILSEVPWLHRALSAQAWTSRLERSLAQAGLSLNVGTLVLLCLVLAAVGLYAARLATDSPLALAALPPVLGGLPLLWVERRRAARMGRLQRQLPDALDLIARALRAGHAFPQGMRMVADEFEDPIGPEFAKTLDEINFGVSADLALLHLVRRVDCPDLRFFVVSVNIQRETGGNLAEIVGNIATLVRERFKLEGKVRVLSAEGRLTAWILLALPFAVALVISIINPEYMAVLRETREGRVLSTLAMVWMAVGALALKRLTRITV